MRKEQASLAIAILLFLNLLVVAASQQIGIQTVHADSNDSTIYGSTYFLSYPSEEYDITYDVCSSITLLFSSTNNYACTYNHFGSGTVKSSILSAVASEDDYYDYVAFFHVGDWWTVQETGWYCLYEGGEEYWYPSYVDHYTYYDSYGALVKDLEIYPQISEGRHYFVFLWTCQNGVECGYYDEDREWFNWYYYGTGAVGMPFAWTHHTDLSPNGYAWPDSTNYCFISFHNQSPFPYTPVDDTNYVYADFAVKFYEGALSNGRTINEALDYATAYVWDGTGKQYFSESDLYAMGRYYVWNEQQESWETGCMRVYGNGDSVIPQ